MTNVFHGLNLLLCSEETRGGPRLKQGGQLGNNCHNADEVWCGGLDPAAMFGMVRSDSILGTEDGDDGNCSLSKHEL